VAGTLVIERHAVVLWRRATSRTRLGAMRCSLIHRARSSRSPTSKQTEARQDTLHDLDKEEQRAFWVRSAQYMWAGREIERRCPNQAPHAEHNYRYDSTPGYLMYWCRGQA
jgi:hypothetical protein